MTYYCVAASTVAVLLALGAFWQARSRNSRRSPTPAETSMQTPINAHAPDARASAPCDNMYEELLDLPSSNLQDDVPLHDRQQNSRGSPQPSPLASQKDYIPLYDLSIPKLGQE